MIQKYSHACMHYSSIHHEAKLYPQISDHLELAYSYKLLEHYFVIKLPEGYTDKLHAHRLFCDIPVRSEMDHKSAIRRYCITAP